MAFVHALRPIGLTLAAALLTGGVLWTLAPAQDAPANAPNSEAPFLAANDAAMETMMKDMAIKPSGDVDRDFVAMMVPHHQGAIDMAGAQLHQRGLCLHERRRDLVLPCFERQQFSVHTRRP